MEEGDAGADHEFGAGKAKGEVAEGFYGEGGGDSGVVHGEAYFFPGLAAGDLV